MANLIIPKKNVSTFIRALAEKNGVNYVESSLDKVARVVTRMAGDDVTPDDVEGLLINLSRKGCIAGAEMMILHSRYLDEIKSTLGGSQKTRRQAAQ